MFKQVKEMADEIVRLGNLSINEGRENNAFAISLLVSNEILRVAEADEIAKLIMAAKWHGGNAEKTKEVIDAIFDKYIKIAAVSAAELGFGI